jgi:hypothetical protein
MRSAPRLHKFGSRHFKRKERKILVELRAVRVVKTVTEQLVKTVTDRDSVYCSDSEEDMRS